MPDMSAARAPAFWLSVAAMTVTVVAVAAMALSGPHRSLTFADSVLFSDHAGSATPRAAGRSGGSAGPSRTQARGTLAPVIVGGTGLNPAPVVSWADPSGTRVLVNPPSPPATSARPTPTPTPSGTPPNPVPATAGDGPDGPAAAVFAALNAARRELQLPPLEWDAGLQRSAAGHNLAMAAAGELEPRVGREPALGAREANQGVHGDYAAENLACTPLAGLTELAGALAAQQSMLAERTPDGSRRQNLLSTTVNAVGIGVLADPADGRLWLTEDFAEVR